MSNPVTPIVHKDSGSGGNGSTGWREAPHVHPDYTGQCETVGLIVQGPTWPRDDLDHLADTESGVYLDAGVVDELVATRLRQAGMFDAADEFTTNHATPATTRAVS